MSVQLLDKTRKINKLLHNNNSHKVVFNDICKVLSEILLSNILVISKKGKVLGVSICSDVDEIEELIEDQVGGYVDKMLNERLLSVLSTKENVNLATLGFAEIIRAVFQWQALGPITNGANMITQIPTFSSFNIKTESGTIYLSSAFPMLIMILCLAVIVMLINSSYGRAFKAIREDEIAAEAMGINLPHHKMLSFCISSFFAGVGGALFAMYASNAQAMVYTSTMTYEILLIVVIGGIGSISGSVIATFLYVACSEWWLRFLDSEMVLANGLKVPFLRNGFRLVVFSIIIMIVVLFFRRGIMGDKELPDLFRRRAKRRKEAIK